MAIFKECMRCVNTPFHSQILHLFQFANEMSNSDIYKFSQNNLYSSNFVNVPADLSCKLFNTLIRPILLYNSEVWFMENYLSIYKSVDRSRSHGTIWQIFLLQRCTM
jgi:hypothetical protein